MNSAPADLEAHSTRLWRAVVADDEYAAVDAATDALRDGLTPETMLLEVIAPVQDRVGREWAADRMTVAQEHIATAVCDRAVSILSRPVHQGFRATGRDRGGVHGRRVARDARAAAVQHDGHPAADRA